MNRKYKRTMIALARQASRPKRIAIAERKERKKRQARSGVKE